MTKSFELVVDGVIDALRAHVLPKSDDDFVRGQVFSIIFALNGLKLAADWKTGPLLEQIRLQDAAFSEVRRLADRCFEALRGDPDYPSLHFKKVGRLWSVRVGLHYRALAVEDEQDMVWFWIGSHAEYDQLIGQ